MLRKALKSLSMGLLTCFCLISLILIGYLYTAGRLQFLHSESRLGAFETRIENVSTEFMRRSPRLKANFETFKSCMQKSDCQPEPILAKRDEIIQKEWPSVFDRLLIDDDWGVLTFTTMAHERFLRAINQAGGKMNMRKHCIPLIRYYHLGNTSYYRQYENDGYSCNPPTPPFS